MLLHLLEAGAIYPRCGFRRLGIRHTLDRTRVAAGDYLGALVQVCRRPATVFFLCIALLSYRYVWPLSLYALSMERFWQSVCVRNRGRRVRKRGRWDCSQFHFSSSSEGIFPTAVIRTLPIPAKFRCLVFLVIFDAGPGSSKIVAFI